MRRTTQILILFAALQHPLAAQTRWSATLERGTTRFSATAHDTSSPPIRLVPWHPTLYTFRLAREGSRHGLAIALSYGHGDLAASVGDIVVLPGFGLTLFEVATEGSVRVASVPGGATMRLHAGPVVDLWFPSGDDMRTTYGGLVGTSLALPLASRWEVTLRADFALTTGEMTAQEATAEITRESTLRRGRLGLGITRHL